LYTCYVKNIAITKDAEGRINVQYQFNWRHMWSNQVHCGISMRLMLLKF